ncbi:MAG: phosphate ABC transporter substrate-binding protein [Holophagaceae bacterium]|nr:phosphate ABC transporter substrate-binding protein [Holophagaceae bacterium]
MPRTPRILSALAACAVLALPVTAQNVKVDPKLSVYKKVAGISGNLNSVGSDTLNNLMTYWVESFNKQYPNVKIQVEGKGSSTAPPALQEGTSQLGPMSREMKGEEMDKFEKKYGYKPTKIAVAIDTLAVFVHKDNPLKEITMEEVDAIFSKTRKWGAKADVKSWGQLGLKGEWAARPISMYGRNSASGTYGYFKEHALNKGDYKDTVKEQPGSSSVVQSVSTDKGAIGYSGIGYATSGVRAVPMSMKGRYNDQAFQATYENALSGKYPMTRFLFVYVNKDPKKPMDPLTREFLKFVLSKEGQEIVVKDGYLPLTAAMEGSELKKVQ